MSYKIKKIIRTAKIRPVQRNYLICLSVFTSAEKSMMLKLRGAYKEDCTIPGSEAPSDTQTLCFYINRDLETEFSLIPAKVCHRLN